MLQFTSIIFQSDYLSKTVRRPLCYYDSGKSIFDVTTAVTSGTYEVRVRNAVGGSNSKEITVNWNVGSISWSTSGASTAGGVVTLSGKLNIGLLCKYGCDKYSEFHFLCFDNS